MESLAWLNDGQILAVGCQWRAVQLYHLRVSGANSPPLSVSAHSEAVLGIVPDPFAAMTFATFGRNADEPVRVWDARMNHSPVSEMPLPRSIRRGRGGGFGFGGGGGVGAVAWLVSRLGVLSVGFKDTILHYNTRGPGSRAVALKRRAKAETVSLRAIIYGTLRSSERQKVWSKDLFLMTSSIKGTDRPIPPSTRDLVP